jgi:DNA-binding transcriptional LysR family regulator
MVPHLPLQALQVFMAVARKRSFTLGAREAGVTTSAASQSVRHLESFLGQPLLTRTTRSVALTEAGRRLLAGATPALERLSDAVTQTRAGAGELAGQLRLSVPSVAVPLVIDPVLPRFLGLHPRVTVEVNVDDRLIDVVGEGYDAGIRFGEAVQRDMVRIRLTGPQRFLVVGSPAYLARRGTPKHPEELLGHDCINYRSATTDTLYLWELEHGRRRWRLPVRGPVVTNDLQLLIRLAAAGHGLAYVFEPAAAGMIERGELVPVLLPFTPGGSELALYFPERARLLPALRAFADTARAALSLPRRAMPLRP